MRRALLLYALALGAYVGVGHATLARSAPLAASALDRAIPFDARFAPVYLGYFPFLLWALLRLARAPDFGRVLCGAALVVLASLLLFLGLPTRVTRPPAPDAGWCAAALAWIQRVDPPTNALPSLHASLMVLACAAGVRRGLLPGAVALPCCALVLYAALAIKQHGVLDLGSGALLGGAAAAALEIVRARALPRGEAT